MSKLGNNLRTRRQSTGLTQRAAARDLGLTPVHLCNLERGHSTPSHSLLLAIAELYGVAPATLLAGVK